MTSTEIENNTISQLVCQVDLYVKVSNCYPPPPHKSQEKTWFIFFAFKFWPINSDCLENYCVHMLSNHVGWLFCVKPHLYFERKQIITNKPTNGRDSNYLTEENNLVNEILSDHLNVSIACPRICNESPINIEKSSFGNSIPLKSSYLAEMMTFDGFNFVNDILNSKFKNSRKYRNSIKVR